MSFIGNELVPNMTAVLDKAMVNKTVERSEYHDGFYDGAMAMIKALTEVFGDDQCAVVFDGTWHNLRFKPIENEG